MRWHHVVKRPPKGVRRRWRDSRFRRVDNLEGDVGTLSHLECELSRGFRSQVAEEEGLGRSSCRSRDLKKPNTICKCPHAPGPLSGGAFPAARRRGENRERPRHGALSCDLFLSEKSLGPQCSWLDHVQVLSFASRTLISSFLFLFYVTSHFLSCHVSSHRIVSCLILSHLLSFPLILSALISSYLSLANPTYLILVAPYLILSHRVSSPLILSYLF